MKCVKLNRLLVTTLYFVSASLILSVSSAGDTSRDDWTITLGVGTFHGPEYVWSDEAETMISPNFEVVWKDTVFLDLDGISINYYKIDSIVLNAIVSQGDERKEGASGRLNGVGNINASTALTLGAEIDSGFFLSYANLTRHIGGTDGVQAIVGMETAFPLRMLTGNFDMANMAEETEDFTLIGPLVTAALSAEWADNDYTKGFFGVDAEQSTRSGLPQYTAAAGFRSVNLELGLLYPVGRSWMVQGLAGYSKLIGDAEDSPVVKANDYVFVGGFINYHF